MTSNEELLRTAISQKRNVSAIYKGLYRELSPHALGMKNGKLNLLSYQYGGESASGLTPGSSENWRCMPVGALSEVSLLTSEDWHSVSPHSRTNSCIDDVFIEIDY